jgi:heat shock protein HslJ
MLRFVMALSAAAVLVQEPSPFREGRLTLDSLAGTEWVLRQWTVREPAVADPRITIRFKAGSVAGTSGCNTFTAPVGPGDAPLSVKVGELVTTRRACPEPAMAVETRFVRTLQAVDGYGFLLGQLALSYQLDGQIGTLLFDPIVRVSPPRSEAQDRADGEPRKPEMPVVDLQAQ